jgi:Protein of unknown function (DUF3047)
MKKRLLRIAGYSAVTLLILAVAGYFAFQKLTSPPSPTNPVLASAEPTVTLMDFGSPPARDPLSAGWWEIGFLTKPKMQISFVDKDSVKALRCETHGSGSIFGRHTDIDLQQFPKLTWNWRVEQPVVADAPETEWKGDDHPARLLVHLRDSAAKEHYFEIIWSNGAFKAGQWKIIGSFHHYVANGGNAKTGENTNTWFTENVNLLDLYHTATGRIDNARLINIAIFCDTDDTGANSIAYFGKVTLAK